MNNKQTAFFFKIQQIPDDSIKTPVLEVHPYRAEFTATSKTIIDNMFQEYTARRYLQGSAQKFKRKWIRYFESILSKSMKLKKLL